MQPMQSSGFDPGSAFFDTSGMKIKCRSNAEHQACIKAREHPAHEEFLAWSTNSYPNNIRLALCDDFNQIQSLPPG